MPGNILGPWKQSTRKLYPNGNLSYQAVQSTLNFYDKPLELARNGYEIPDNWIGGNVLRIERQAKKAVKDQFKQEVFGDTLG
ncbi:MAG: hypothetical protein M3Y08_09215 [Fibrobacterota bacterium]|nr:hypothetical protein [Fibrobacterota bacterium]